MTRPLLIDFYCGTGGAAMGYHQAGFDVIGVDLKPQPRFPACMTFIQGDVLLIGASLVALLNPDGLAASPPCQAHTAMKTMHNAKPHLDLIPQTRALLQASGKPWIMENVVGAPLIDPVQLCGTMFGLGVREAELRRHRLFEANFPISAPGPCTHGARDTIGIYGGHVRNRRRAPVVGVYGKIIGPNARKARKDKGLPDFTVDDGRVAMGIDWMTQPQLSQAIPPAYTRHLGQQLMEQIR